MRIFLFIFLFQCQIDLTILDDFTPASIDKNQESKVTIGPKHDVQILVPHVEVSQFVLFLK